MDTSNITLEAVSAKKFNKDFNKNSLQVTASEICLATFLCLKHPGNFAELPFDMLLTDAYGALSSGDKLWKNFVHRLKELRKNKELSEEDFNLVRWDNSSFSKVQKASVLSEEDIPVDDIYNMVDAIKQKDQKELKDVIKNKDGEIKTQQKSIAKVEGFIKFVSRFFSVVTTLIYSWLWVIGIFHYGPKIFNIELQNTFFHDK